MNSASIIQFYVLPVVIMIGVTLNLMSLMVMKRIKSTTSFYIRLLALADTGKKKPIDNLIYLFKT